MRNAAAGQFLDGPSRHRFAMRLRVRITSALVSTHHSIIHKDRFAYCAHPHAVALGNGEWLMVFNRAPRREIILHPPEEPLFCNVITRSSDEGHSWSIPEVVPGYDWHGVECAGLTMLSSGTVMLNQWRFNWYPLALARAMAAEEELSFPGEFMAAWANSPEHHTWAVRPRNFEDLTPWARGQGRTYVHFSKDGGRSFDETVEIDTHPYKGGYGMRGAVALEGGDLLLPLCDVPAYRTVFTVRSSDGGRTWQAPVKVAGAEGHAFEEPCALKLGSGTLIMLMRDNVTRRLHRVVSDDDGLIWTEPEPLPIEGYPAHLLELADGRILCTYGRRKPPFSIRAALSADEGMTWNIGEEICIRGGLPNANLGYPVTLAAADRSLTTFYYAEDEGVTCIQATRWRL
jgi:BNR repeat-like domain